MTPILFVLAAGSGALVRSILSERLPLPTGTLVVNLVGAFAIGLIEHWTGAGWTVLAVGGLGAMTTFSTLAYELVEMVRDRPWRAVGYLVVTLVGGVGAAALGMAVGD